MLNTKNELPDMTDAYAKVVEEGKKILDESGLKIISASDLGDAAKKIVKQVE